MQRERKKAQGKTEVMKEEGINKSNLSDRFYQFALRVVKLVRGLPKETAAFQIGKQLIKAGTSVSANYLPR